MTSTVRASFGGAWSQVFGALFPCASIVGAPKVKTTEIIRDLEVSPRGVYSGAIGIAGPGKEARFAVCIRTITSTGKKLEYGAGSGIVWDSDPEAEWRETMLKTEVLKTAAPDWGLIETFDRAGQSLERHLDRMERSARELGTVFDRARAQDLVVALENRPMRVRLTCFADGRLALDCSELSVPERIEARLSKYAVRSEDPSLRHKTNRRRVYELALRDSTSDEALLWNERGEATEFCMGNLVADFDGRLLTPPLSCGLLPGVLRSDMLDRGQIEEGRILLSDLESARAIFRINSLTGCIPVDLKKM
jgi:para-aminobenzoate synthetase/4-amino-4-deoxychorismate lyase